MFDIILCSLQIFEEFFWISGSDILSKQFLKETLAFPLHEHVNSIESIDVRGLNFSSNNFLERQLLHKK
jgi:hypothetical protein